ncbi:hypothetical protein BDA99DRAFT_542066 [Phascolomyces articulosus]|uniref:Uncharacterized protein n=1 Tax=Phascolomyces articulosus TaxID=60185 RepID=A0AAD5K0X8_9FUNG|nr:hypothetical protein BDA99DRAFT_542066 [Phascolomyces articulosus]
MMEYYEFEFCHELMSRTLLVYRYLIGSNNRSRRNKSGCMGPCLSGRKNTEKKAEYVQTLSDKERNTRVYSFSLSYTLDLIDDNDDGQNTTIGSSRDDLRTMYKNQFKMPVNNRCSALTTAVETCHQLIISIVESVNSVTTTKKQETYENKSNIIDFKIDIRLMYDGQEHELDLSAREISKNYEFRKKRYSWMKNKHRETMHFFDFSLGWCDFCRPQNKDEAEANTRFYIKIIQITSDRRRLLGGVFNRGEDTGKWNKSSSRKS